MKILIIVVLLLQTAYSQRDSLLKVYLDQSALSLTAFVNDIEDFFNSFPVNDPAARSSDTTQIIYFDVMFSSPLEYNLYGKMLNVDFNYMVADSLCNNSNRNGLLLLEKLERTPAANKKAEIVNRTVYVLIPDKCSTTRFYNSKNDMFCNNKMQFDLEYEEGKATAEILKVRVGMQLLSNSQLNYFEKYSPAVENYPVDTYIHEYILRCCIRSIIFIKGSEIMENYVSLK
jgi:hypothetical protein